MSYLGFRCLKNSDTPVGCRILDWLCVFFLSVFSRFAPTVGVNCIVLKEKSVVILSFVSLSRFFFWFF